VAADDRKAKAFENLQRSVDARYVKELEGQRSQIKLTPFEKKFS
jgi:hypothetical protein